MPRERTFWMVLVTLVVVGMIAGVFGQRAGVETLALTPDAPRPQPQSGKDRLWREVRFDRLASIPAGPTGLVEMPTLIRVDRHGGLYVLDSGRSAVVKLSPAGRLLATYRDAAVGNPTDVAIGNNGEVWVCDPDNAAIAVFSPGGRLARRLSFDPAIGRLALAPGGGFVATALGGGKGLFRRYSAEGETTGAFGALFQEELQTAVAADGWIVSSGPGTLIYPFRNAGLLISYSIDGRLRYFRETIAPMKLPEVKIDAAGRQSLVEGTPVSTVNGSAAGDSLFLLSIAGSERVLDVYGAADGTYRHSMKPPEPDARYVVLTEDRLYSASQRGVTIWRRPAE